MQMLNKIEFEKIDFLTIIGLLDITIILVSSFFLVGYIFKKDVSKIYSLLLLILLTLFHLGILDYL